MFLKNDKCYIEIKFDETYTIDSLDNQHYDIVLNPDEYQPNQYSKTLSIHINQFSKEYHIAMVGSYFTSDNQCAILEDDILTVLQNDMITQIRVSDGIVVRNKKYDGFESNFEIYSVPKGYIVYGELEITMLDFNLNKVWTFAGADIFVSVTNKIPFRIQNNSICLYDFQDNYYEIDFNGKQKR